MSAQNPATLAHFMADMLAAAGEPRPNGDVLAGVLSRVLQPSAVVAWRWKSDLFRTWQVVDQEPPMRAEMERRTGLNMQGLEAQPLSVAWPTWRTMGSAPKDSTSVIIAVPTQHKHDFIVGEAYFDPEHLEGGDWWWAGTGHNIHGTGPISDCNFHAPAFWTPMPTISAPKLISDEADRG